MWLAARGGATVLSRRGSEPQARAVPTEGIRAPEHQFRGALKEVLASS